MSETENEDRRGLVRILNRNRRDAALLVHLIRERVPSCGVVPVDQRERLKSERYGQ